MLKKIYALIVGITEYKEELALDNGAIIFPKLHGCVNDAHKIKSFLTDNYAESSLSIKELYNSDATKINITDAFLNHLGKAGEEDAVLFYFSGHGTQERADKCFTTETDGKLESLVAYYDKATINNCLIADKELRYLVNEVAKKKTHFTVVIDCCHSGDVTRNAEIVKVNYDAPVEKKSKSTYTFSQRKWSDFIFHEKFSTEDVTHKGINTLLPEGDHILFSASESNESAFEIKGEGIFTKHFINCLNLYRGALSNQMLFDRVAMQMEYAYVQKPRLYTPPQSAKLRNTGFLNAEKIFIEGSAMVAYNEVKGWILNRGELNGLYAGLENIDLYDSSDKSKLFKATIETLKIDHAILNIQGATDPGKTYIADLDYLAKRPVKLYLALDDTVPKDAACLLENMNVIPTHEVDVVSNEADADFTLQHLNGLYYITRKADKYRPISEVVAYPNYEAITGQLKHLSSWKYIYELSRTQEINSSPGNYLQVEYAFGKDEYKTLSTGGKPATITIGNWDIANGNPSTILRVKLINKSPGSLYVSLLYLDINFASYTFLLEPSPYRLEKDGVVELNVSGDPLLPVTLCEQALYFNYREYKERFKIIVSDKAFEIYPLKLDMLPEPPLPGAEVLMNTRDGVRRGSIGQPKPLEGWFTVTIDVVNTNPLFNKLSFLRLNQMLEDKITEPFAEGLFFTKDPGGQEPSDTLANTLRLCDDITMLEELEGQRGAIIDVANWWARRKRNKYYEEIARRYPERTKIVSEGDSWFQHPLVYDTIDHLSKIYAIRCVAAAGDTLANYFSGAKKEGDYFLDVLRDIKPPVFLISGGGNDILGSQFRGFLQDKPYDMGLKNSTDGSKFLKETFAFQIDKIMSIYSAIFTLLKSEFPAMVTIVHGYDYPVHLDYTNKGWLGRYMIEKGISEPADRRTVINYIMNVFNERLSELVGQFPGTVRYLDLRHTVLFKKDEIDQWYDEIHPNKDGFQSVGLKFIKLIESLKN